MANNYFINIRLETATAKQATELRKELHASFEQARVDNVGAYFGSDRYLFDAYVRQRGTRVTIGGWVKWGYCDYEFVDMFNWLRSQVTIKKFKMQYEEWLCFLYGEFELHEGGVMWKNFLQEKDFPPQTPSDCEDFDGYRGRVRKVFRKKFVTKLIEVG